VLATFRLANRAMAMAQRAQRPGREPRWHPFQLAFLLLNLPPACDGRHLDSATGAAAGLRALRPRLSRTALFPPPGIDDSETFFAEVDRDARTVPTIGRYGSLPALRSFSLPYGPNDLGISRLSPEEAYLQRGLSPEQASRHP
jgi:hypothetical protein